MRILKICIVISACFIVFLSTVAESKMISEQEAIEIARNTAIENKYDVNNADVETLRVSDGFERGPVRLTWIIKRLSSKDEINRIMNSKFWIIYFYPKDLFKKLSEGGGILDGCFCCLVDITTGEVILYSDYM